MKPDKKSAVNPPQKSASPSPSLTKKNNTRSKKTVPSPQPAITTTAEAPIPITDAPSRKTSATPTKKQASLPTLSTHPTATPETKAPPAAPPANNPRKSSRRKTAAPAPDSTAPAPALSPEADPPKTSAPTRQRKSRSPKAIPSAPLPPAGPVSGPTPASTARRPPKGAVSLPSTPATETTPLTQSAATPPAALKEESTAPSAPKQRTRKKSPTKSANTNRSSDQTASLATKVEATKRSTLISTATPEQPAQATKSIASSTASAASSPIPSAAPQPKGAAAPRKKPLHIPPILLEGDATSTPAPSGPGTRYTLAASPTPPRPLDTPGDLPESYGTGQLFLTARDAHWLYAWWDLSREQQQHLNAQTRSGTLSLRVYHEARERYLIADMLVHPESKNWFTHVPHAESSYSAELGFYNRNGEWRSVATSRRTFTPAEEISEDVTAKFATIPVEVSFDQLVQAVQEFAAEHHDLAEAILQVEESQEKQPDPGPSQEPTSSAPQNIAPEPAPLSHLPEAELSAPTGEPAPSPAPARNQILQRLLPTPEHKNSESRWTPEKSERLHKLVHLDSYRRVWMGSMEITELIRRRLQEEISSIAAAELARRGQSEAAPGAAFGISSPTGGEVPTRRKFWFNVNAELIIYGATEPGATVQIAGRTINLRPDGSFSYRFALPDGRYDLPAIAISHDKEEQRHAILHFLRASEYHGQVEPHPQDPSLKPPGPNAL